MFCSNCGNQIADNSNVCQYCGTMVKRNTTNMQSGYGMQTGYGYGGMQRGPVIDNIFSALVHEKTPGAIWEFSIWCTLCVLAVLSLVITILTDGLAVELVTMLFLIGMAVVFAFRLKSIGLLCMSVLFEGIIGIMRYVTYTEPSAVDYYDELSFSGILIAIFVITILVAVAAVACSAVHFFSPINLRMPCLILKCSAVGMQMLLNIVMFTAPYTGKDASYVNASFRRELANHGYYWFSTSCFWVILIITVLFYFLYFLGPIDNRKEKIISRGATPGAGNVRVNQQQLPPYIYGMAGNCAGRSYYLNGGMLTIGANANMSIVIQDGIVSQQHCSIRFNANNGCYEIYDNSTNGTYLQNGTRLQKGVYNSVQRGSVVYIGSRNQQFQLR